jgi:hypothetical protein
MRRKMFDSDETNEIADRSIFLVEGVKLTLVERLYEAGALHAYCGMKPAFAA